MDSWIGAHLVRRHLAVLGVLLPLTAAVCALAPVAASASSYTISRYAGIVSNTGSGATPGPATSTSIGFPGGVAIDSSGDVYVTDVSNTDEVYKISPSGTLSIFAGDGSYGPPTPGQATSSDLDDPSGVAVDSAGNVYIADADNGVVEKVTPSGVLSIFAGNASTGSGPTVAGPATSTQLGIPTAVAVDSSGNVYISDSGNDQVYEVTPSGVLSIIGGNGTSSSPGMSPPLPAVPGPALNSPLDGPSGVAVDSGGDVFVSVTNPGEVVEITPAGNLSVIAGTGTQGAPTEGPATNSDLGTPQGLAIDGAGDVYIADSDYEYIEEVTPDGMLSFVAGDGVQGTPTFAGPATASDLNAPYGIASDPLGRLYFTDSANYTLDLLVAATPVNTAAPTLSGGVDPGNTVTATEGAWSNDPVLFSYQWQDCDTTGANCTDITSATSSSYQVSSSDAGHTLRVVVTAENSGGDTAADSAVTAVVPVPGTTSGGTTTTPGTPTTPTPVAAGSGDGASLSAKAAGAGVAVSAVGELVLPLVCPQTSGGCDADGNLTLALAGGRTAHATTTVSDSVIARFAGVKIEAGHSRLVSVHLSAAATRYLQARGVRRVRVTLTIHNHLSGGPAITTAQQVLLNIAPLQAACRAASGSLTATSIGGQLTLGMTQAQAHRVGRAHRATYGFASYCLKGGRIRVASPVAKLIQHLSTAQRHRVASRLIIELTGNRHYAIRGVSAGTKLTTAAHKLNLGSGITVGRNTWYRVTSRTGAWVFKAQAGTIDEIGVVDRSLTRTASQRRYLWRHL